MTNPSVKLGNELNHRHNNPTFMTEKPNTALDSAQTEGKNQMRSLILGGIIPVEDHRFRMERMLYSERAKSAGRIAKLARAEALATAWSAVLRNDPKADELLDAVTVR